jgi:uncharacterized membrane protein
MEFLRIATLILSAVSMGLMAGVFGLYANAIMPGLRRTDDRTFVGAFQQIDTAIINPLFLVTFFGALLFTSIAALLHLGADERSTLPWIAAAFVLYLAVVAVTLRINVPLNDNLKTAGDPDLIRDLRAVRARFSETTWVRWNTIRALATTAAFVCLAWALVLHGRATP